jgi:hypothetical protein
LRESDKNEQPNAKRGVARYNWGGLVSTVPHFFMRLSSFFFCTSTATFNAKSEIKFEHKSILRAVEA